MLAFLVLTLFFLQSSFAQLSSYWTNKDIDRIKLRSQEIIHSSKSSQDIYFSLQLVNYLDKEKLEQSYCDCKNILARGKSSALELAYALKSNDLCKCGYEVTSQDHHLVTNSLQSDDVNTLLGGLYAGVHLKELTLEQQIAGVSKLKSLLSKENDLQLLIEDPSTDLEQSLLIARRLLDTLVELHRSEPTINEFTNEVYEKAFQFIPSGNHDLYSDATFLAGLSKLSEAEKVKLSPVHLAESSDALLSLRHVEDPYTLLQAFEASSLVSRNKKSPVYIDMKAPKFTSNTPASHILEFSAKNLLGKELKIESLEVLFVKTVGKDQNYLQGETIGTDEIDLSGQRLSAGRYQVSVMVSIKNKPVRVSYQSYFIITDEVSISEVYTGVTTSTQATNSDLSAVSIPNSFFAAANAVNGEILHVSFQVIPASGTGKIRKPHQAVIRLTEETSGVSVYFAATKVGESSTHEYSLAIPLINEVERFHYQSGNYMVSIFAADATYTTPLEFLVGSVELKFPSRPAPNHPLYAKSLLHASDVTLKALPEIEHMMRPPPKRASAFMSTLFSGVVILPFVVFVGFLMSLKPNLARFGSLSTISFFVAFVALLLLYLGYWLAVDGFTFYTTIQYLCLLFPVIIFLGSYALSSVMSARLKEQKKERVKSE